MKKQTYFAPETTCVYVEIEATLCQSAGGEFENFDNEEIDFPMLSFLPPFESIL